MNLKTQVGLLNFQNVQCYSEQQGGLVSLRRSLVSILKFHIIFPKKFINDIITFDTLKFELTEDLIAEAIGVPIDRESWFKKIPFSFNPNNFLLLGNETIDWGKGVPLEKFKPEWKEAIGIVHNYITCNGRLELVFKYHIRFLQNLNQQSKMNFPFFLLKSLQKMSNRAKGHFNHTN